MKESVTYQEIFEEGFQDGFEKGLVEGRIKEMRKILLRGVAFQFGPAEASVNSRIDAIADLELLEQMYDRLVMRVANILDELLSQNS